MPKSNYLDAGLLELLFQAVALPNVADNAASAPLTNLWQSLHTSSPGPGGNQSTNEAAYTGYTRVPVARTSGGWTLTGDSVSPVSPITFPLSTGGSETETWWGIGVGSSGATELLYFGVISPSIVVTSGVTPILTTASIVTET